MGEAMDPSISGAVADAWILDPISAEEIESAEEIFSQTMRIRSATPSAALAVTLAAFIQRRAETAACGDPDGCAMIDGGSEDIMAIEISDEQIERAAKAMYGWEENCRAVMDDPNHALRWSAVRESSKMRFRQAARVAAPHLQAPIDPPTESEILLVRGTGTLPPPLLAIHKFIDLRNAALFPAPLDPRRVKITATLRRHMDPVAPSAINEITDEIIVLLDVE